MLWNIVSVSVYLFLFFASEYECSSNIPEAEVKYYEELIKTKRSEAFHDYQLPTSAERFRPRNHLTKEFGDYDFIVIGSGSAGAVIGARLSEIQEWKILVLEAGGPEDNYTNIPAEQPYLQGLRYNWNFNTVPQTTACLGMVNRTCAIPRGQVLGGTSTINGLLYCRGNKADYDAWADLGNVGWSYKDVLPYFIKSENAQVVTDPGYHGRDGPWNVEYHKPVSPQLLQFIEASRELYQNYTSFDYNGREQLGMFTSQLNTIHGMRDSTARSFVKSAEYRKNLKISMNSYVTKVLIDTKTKAAYGVEFAKNGHNFKALAKREVIISGGTINSPQILMLSGVGPSNHLRNMGIPVLQDLPVGRVLIDHTAFYGLYIHTNLTQPVQNLSESIKQYLNGYGPLSIALNNQGTGFYYSKNHSVSSSRPDIEFEVIPSISINPFLQKSMKLRDDIHNELGSRVNPQTDVNVFVVVLHPLSHGYIQLKSNDPYTYPLVNFKLLSDPQGEDINTMYQAVLIFKKFLQTESMKKINASIIYPQFSQCRDFVTDSRDYWYCSFRLLTSHFNHPIATCKMGIDPKKGAVVDHKLKVYGINNLRVADASVIPLTTSGHTSAPSVMIGEKISDIIKLNYGKPIQPIDNVIRDWSY